MKFKMFFVIFTICLLAVPITAQTFDDPLNCDDADIESLEFGEVIVLTCDDDCAGGSIWGTGIYTNDSDVCTAAVHAGVIDAEDGGEFIVYIVQGLSNYPGSEMNGVESSDWTSDWDVSFTFDPYPLELSWSDNAQSIEGDTGSFVLAACDEDGDTGSLWGTDIYTDDSSVCTAAVHAGAIDAEDGGFFYVSILDGLDEYDGSEQNEISSSDWTSGWERSFAITPLITDISWSTSANELTGPAGISYWLSCDPDGDIGSAWGSDIYTDDSSVCTAAAHAGVITVESGGIFIMTIEDGLDEYIGSEQNEISTSDWTSGWERSFTVGFWTQEQDSK